MELKSEYKRSITFGTWNVRALTEKKREVVAEIERENKDVVVLTETKLRGAGKEECSNYVHIYSGIRVGPPKAGVSVLIKKEHAKQMRWKVINERIIQVWLHVLGQKIVLLGVYGVDDNSSPQVKDKFLETLTETIKKVKKRYELVILGDMNARVGRSSSSNVVGRYGEREISDNGLRLVKICAKYGLKIQNTFFKHEDIHKYTHYDHARDIKSIIDYCITKQVTSLEIIDVIACRWLDVLPKPRCKYMDGTDHVYVEAIVDFTSTQVITSSIFSYNTYLLFSETYDEMYKQYLEESITLTKEKSATELYEQLKDAVHNAAHSVLGVATEQERSKFLWDIEMRDIMLSRKIKREIKENANISLEISSPCCTAKIKNEMWKGVCTSIDSIPNQKQKIESIWNILNEFRNRYNPVTLKDTEITEVFFKNYFKEMRSEFANVKEEVKEKFELIIFPADVIQALNDLEDKDVPSPGGISMRLLKHGSHKMKRLLKELIQTIFNGQKIPEEINETFIIYQSDDERKLNSVNKSIYVPHSIMQIMGMIVKNFLEKEEAFKEKCKIIHEESRLNATFIMRQLIQKCVEKQNKPLHLIFINLEETLMDIPRTKLFCETHRFIIGETLMELIKHLYLGNKMRIIFPSESSESFPVTKGLRKECPLSLTLFQMYVREAMKKWLKENEKKGFQIENVKLFSLVTQHTNLVIFSDNVKHLGTAVEGLLKQLKKINLHINFRNFKYLRVGEEQDVELMIDKVPVPSEDFFEYVGSILENGGRNEVDIDNRILSSKYAIGLLHSVARDRLISEENKKSIFYSIVVNLLTFGCETWTMTEQLMGRIHTAEMAYWKWCCEKYPEYHSKTRMYDLMDVKESVRDIVEMKRASWYSKVKLMPDHRWPRRVMEWSADGRNKVGGRRKQWIEGIEEFIHDLSSREGFIAKSRYLQNIIIQNRQNGETNSSLSET